MRKLGKRARCLKCQHCLLFQAKDGERYVCTLRGKRLWEDEEDCKLFVEEMKGY